MEISKKRKKRHLCQIDRHLVYMIDNGWIIRGRVGQMVFRYKNGHQEWYPYCQKSLQSNGGKDG